MPETQFEHFTELTQSEVHCIIMTCANKTCSLDILPVLNIYQDEIKVSFFIFLDKGIADTFLLILYLVRFVSFTGSSIITLN